MRVLFSLAWTSILVSAYADPIVAAATRPSIIVILSDDMGWSDLGCFGGEIETPNLDGLAAGGIRFTQFYNTARCCPTRASLLTGLYPHQAGVGHMMEDKGKEGYRGDLQRNCLTIAEVLRTAGYRTYAVGKWHVTPGQEETALGRRHNWPLRRGFDRFYGTIHGAGSYWDPSALVRDDRLTSPALDPEYAPSEPYYYTDALSDHAIRFIGEHARESAGSPFFLYLAYTAAHWPLHARERDIAKYRGRYDAGYAAIRAARRAKAERLGLVDPAWAPGRPAGDWDSLKPEDRAFEARCMEVYAASVDAMDQGIGRILAELRKQGLFDDTLILFLQDNGACAELMGRGAKGEPRADAPTLPPLPPEHRQQGSVPRQTRDGYPVRQGLGVMPGPADTYIAYGRAWANVSNTPFREYKHWVHEGGISTPLIAHWPNGIAAARRGALESSPGHLIDIAATCVDLSGALYPKDVGGRSITPLEGVSLRTAFEGKPIARASPIFWEHEGNRAVRDGPWKLVAKGPAGAWELYDMRTDRTETHDLAAERPEMVKDLSALWEAWAKRTSVLPWIWDPPYGQKAASRGGSAPAK